MKGKYKMILEIISLLSISFFVQGCNTKSKTRTKLLKNNKTKKLKLLSTNIKSKKIQISGTLGDIITRGQLRCGVSQGLPGFSNPDEGEWTGIDVDLARAVAAAIFGDSLAVKFIHLSAKKRFSALNGGEVDMVSRNTAWTLSRDTKTQLTFAGINYYDGQGFMVRKDLGKKSAKELDGVRICVQTKTTTELNIADYFNENGMKYENVEFDTSKEVRQGYKQRKCDAYSTDISDLTSLRNEMGDPNAHIILPEVISKEPLGPFVRQGDDKWADIVRWCLNAMIAAEEYGITQANVDQIKKDSNNPEIKRFLGVEGTLGEKLGLPKDWSYQIIKQVGNYGESFERNLGINTPVGLERGMNNLWTKGGLMYSPPFR
jgi:general L-amino acid transport system substrate-binding protein